MRGVEAEAQVAEQPAAPAASWTPNCRMPPISTPHASATASVAPVVAPWSSATATRAAIWAAFHSTGAT